MQTEGKLIIRRNKKGKLICEVDIGKKQPMRIPYFYKIEDESLNGKSCIVTRKGGQIVEILVDGKELPRKVLKEQIHNVGKTGHSKQSSKNRSISQRINDSFKLSMTFLPKDTREIVGLNDIDNFSLKLNKGARFEKGEDELKFSFFKTDKGKIKYKINPNFGTLNIANLQNRLYNTFKNLGLEVKTLNEVSPDWRLIVGLGTESVYETSMTLHHIYGFPYIPGQAVKGAMRSWVICEYFNQNEEKALKSKLFCDIFGCPTKSVYGKAFQGNLYFLDVFPTTTPFIEFDVMNTHYSKYYNGDKPPVDYMNPIPITFLTVGKETKFIFTIGILPQKNRYLHYYEDYETEEGKNFVAKLMEKCESNNFKLIDIGLFLLREALSNHGIGAKTAVGYGYFS